MPHQCVRCNKMYSDGAKEILKGCSCGARLFFYVKKKDVDRGKELANKLSVDDKKQIETDVTEILDIKKQDKDLPVVLDLESIRILAPGKYELDLVHMFKKDPLVVKLEEGKYVIDLPQVFKGEKKE